MSTTFESPKTRSSHPEDKVSATADRLVKEAGETMVEVTKDMGIPVSEGDEEVATTKDVIRGREVQLAEESWPVDGPRERVSVTKRPSFFRRLFRRGGGARYGDVDRHEISVGEGGRATYTTVRPSVLGGYVTKTTHVGVSEDGTKNVSYDITRYDADGNIVPRGKQPDRIIFDRFANQSSSREVAMDRDREREIDKEGDPERREDMRRKERKRREESNAKKKVVLDTSSAIAAGAKQAVEGGKRDLGPKPGIDRNGRSVPQVPKAAKKYAEGYQAKRRAEQEALEQDPTTLEHAAAKHWDI